MSLWLRRLLDDFRRSPEKTDLHYLHVVPACRSGKSVLSFQGSAGSVCGFVPFVDAAAVVRFRRSVGREFWSIASGAVRRFGAGFFGRCRGLGGLQY